MCHSSLYQDQGISTDAINECEEVGRVCSCVFVGTVINSHFDCQVSVSSGAATVQQAQSEYKHSLTFHIQCYVVIATKPVHRLRGTMLLGKSSTRIGMKVSNRCSIIALVFLCPFCYPWRNCYFGRKCYVVEIWFFVDWQSVATLVCLLWLLNTTLNLMTLFVLVLHVSRTVFGFIFLN